MDAEIKEMNSKAKGYSAKLGNVMDEAERLFGQKREKDAYEKISQAVRFYFSNTRNLKRELTNSELIRFLKEAESESLEKVRGCPEMCGMVEFAKRISDEKNFKETLADAKGIIDMA